MYVRHCPYRSTAVIDYWWFNGTVRTAYAILQRVLYEDYYNQWAEKLEEGVVACLKVLPGISSEWLSKITTIRKYYVTQPTLHVGIR
jgi:hypothetical protein